MVAKLLIPLTSDRRSEFEPCQRVVFLENKTKQKNSAPPCPSSLTCIIKNAIHVVQTTMLESKRHAGIKERNKELAPSKIVISFVCFVPLRLLPAGIGVL